MTSISFRGGHVKELYGAGILPENQREIDIHTLVEKAKETNEFNKVAAAVSQEIGTALQEYQICINSISEPERVAITPPDELKEVAQDVLLTLKELKDTVAVVSQFISIFNEALQTSPAAQEQLASTSMRMHLETIKQKLGEAQGEIKAEPQVMAQVKQILNS
jgi:hypothetical protein